MMILAQMLAANEDKNLSHEQEEWAGTIHAAGRDLLVLINQILDLSKVEAGRIDTHLEPYTIAELRDLVERSFRPIALERKVDYFIEVAEDVPPAIFTDRQLLDQILKNLLSNAFKFTEHGSVKLRLERAPEGTLFRSESLRAAPAVIAFSVSDTGIGIPPDKQEAVFESFQQADTTITRKYGGTGLGLTISREYARILGGEIALESTVGRGTTFRLFLPLARFQESLSAPAPRPSPPSPPPPPATGMDPELRALEGKKILVVEDDVRNLYAITAFLERCKADVLAASSAADAFARLAENHDVALILMDMMMPVMGGVEATRRIRAMPEFAKIPIIAHTAKASDSDRTECMNAGCTDYLAKPVDIRNLASVLARHLGG
jgi:CheY-like chemotaxis protein